MNLTRSMFLLSDQAEDFLRMLYRQNKITGCVKLNFLAAALQTPASNAANTAKQLHEIGLVRYEKYGSVSLTAKGLEYGEKLMQKSRRTS